MQSIAPFATTAPFCCPSPNVACLPSIKSNCSKQIKLPQDLSVFHTSQAYADLVQFILTLNHECQSKQNINENQGSFSQALFILISHLKDLNKLIDEIPPVKQPLRFGNAAFRIWFTQMIEMMPKLTEKLKHLSDCEQLNISDDHLQEFESYLSESFGNGIRIDYGTGHELNFLLSLLCLTKMKFCSSNSDLVCRVIPVYLKLMEKIQLTYYLEPAGSKGAWGLDDYQFLIFLFGSSQLIGNSYEIRPCDITSEKIVTQYKNQYLYLTAIDFINRFKSGAPFSEHSPMLYSISQLSSWQRVNNGLIKMYEKEVLSKFPIVQHIMFGNLIEYKKYQPNENQTQNHSHISTEHFNAAKQINSVKT